MDAKHVTESTISVFISYTHDSENHKKNALALAEALRADGFEVTFDQFESIFEKGLPNWMHDAVLKSNFIIVLCTQAYTRRLLKEEPPDFGRGATWEGGLIMQMVHDSGSRNVRVIPVLFPDMSKDDIPLFLRSALFFEIDPSHLHHRKDPGYIKLCERLKLPASSSKSSSLHMPNPSQTSPTTVKSLDIKKQKLHRTSIARALVRRSRFSCFLRFRNVRYLLSSKYMSWEEVGDILKQLLVIISSDTFHPDYTISIGREGTIIGSIFAINGRFKPFTSIDRDFYVEDGSQQVRIHNSLLPVSVKGKSVLLIDCEVNTGQTMKTAVKYLLEECEASDVRTLAFGVSKSAGYKPNYVGFHYSERLNMPWELTEPIKRSRHRNTLEDRY